MGLSATLWSRGHAPRFKSRVLDETGRIAAQMLGRLAE
jgi:hypothetical protein